MASYIPDKQQVLANWALNLVTLLVAQCGRYGVTQDQANSAKSLVDLFIAALTVALDPSTRTHQTIMQKDEARASMLDLLRPLCQQIRQNLGVAPSDKLALGITVPDNIHTPIAAPTSAPVLQIVGATPLSHTLRYHDANTPLSRAKPSGVTAMELYRAVSETVPAGPQGAELIALVTHQPFAVEFEQTDARKTAYYWGRWVTRRGLVGPYSSMIQMTIAI